jgi:hypothetical protein
MDENWDDADAAEPDEGLGREHEWECTGPDSEAAAWMSGFAASGPPVDHDGVWLQIAAQLDEVESPRRPIAVRAGASVGRGFQRIARFATITGGGWGGPLVVGLFAVLVIAALIAARTSQGHGLS